jgi:murein DD-endopeptidase MepM/ murein hydrolase activator NlpD
MVTISINLPRRYRLHFRLEKKPGRSVKRALLKNLKKFVGKRGGTKIARVFRFFFDRYSIKNLLGANLIILSLGASLINAPTTAVAGTIDSVEVSSPTVLSTRQGVRVPLNAKNVTQGYWPLHRGVDLNGKTGDPVYPMSGGTIVEAGWSNSGYGKNVVVDHGNGYKSLYAHLSEIEVTVGQKIDNETEIGKVGATGRAFGDHLHLELYENDKNINPLTLLPK